MPQRTTPPHLLIHAGGLADAEGRTNAPGSLLIDRSGPEPAILAAGEPGVVARHPAADGAEVIHRPGAVLIPALVNAHTHLDLTHLGPIPFGPTETFTSWAMHVIRGRVSDAEAITASVRDGIARSIRGGVAAVGDIAGVCRLEPTVALRESPLEGVSYHEVFGLGPEEQQGIDRLTWLADRGTEVPPVVDRGVTLGSSPHAPYSAGPSLQAAAAQLQRDPGLPACTHLSECPEELEFIASATGPVRDLLHALGGWDDALAAHLGRGERPIAHVAEALETAPILVAHVNSVTDDEIAHLARTGTRVVYCPRSSTYFRNHEHFGPHRYREMLDAGISVCLGTDSVLNHPPEQADRLTTLDEMRFLFARDGVSAELVLRMATTAGAVALGLDPARFTLAPGPIAGVLAIEVDADGASIDARAAVLQAATLPEWIVGAGAS